MAAELLTITNLGYFSVRIINWTIVKSNSAPIQLIFLFIFEKNKFVLIYLGIFLTSRFGSTNKPCKGFVHGFLSFHFMPFHPVNRHCVWHSITSETSEDICHRACTGSMLELLSVREVNMSMVQMHSLKFRCSRDTCMTINVSMITQKYKQWRTGRRRLISAPSAITT